MNSFYVKNLGDIIDIPYGDYADCRKALDDANANFSKMTARNTAFGRIQLGMDSEFSKIGNMVSEEIIYNVKGVGNVLYLKAGPIALNPNLATRVYSEGNELALDHPSIKMPNYLKEFGKTWAAALPDFVKTEMEKLNLEKTNPISDLRAYALPSFSKVSVDSLAKITIKGLKNVDYFNNLPTPVKPIALLLKDKTSSYAKKILKPNGVNTLKCDIDFKYINRLTIPRSLWFMGLDCYSGLSSYFSPSANLGMRGICD